MLKAILKNTVYRKDEEKEVLAEMEWRFEFVKILTNLIFIFIPTLLIILNVILSPGIKRNICIILLGCITVYALLCAEDTREWWKFIKSDIYFRLFTRKGECIKKAEWRNLEHAGGHSFGEYYTFYDIWAQRANNTSCFWLLNRLEDGYLYIISARIGFDVLDLEESKKCKYKLKFLFVRNEWAFDSTMYVQKPLRKILQLYKAKCYKVCSLKDIEGKKFEEFWQEILPGLKEWAKTMDCYIDEEEFKLLKKSRF